MSLLIFVDESERSGRYLMCSVAVESSAVGTLRRAIRKLLLPGQTQLHFKTESSRRRKELATRLIQFDLDIAVVSMRSATGVNQSQMRDRCLAELIHDAQAREAPVNMFLESRHHQDHYDHASFARWRNRVPPLNYEHVPGAMEPMLWFPDSFAWLVGAGGDWAQRVNPKLRRKWEAS